MSAPQPAASPKLFQNTIEKMPKTPTPTQGNFVPRDDETSYNHPDE